MSFNYKVGRYYHLLILLLQFHYDLYISSSQIQKREKRQRFIFVLIFQISPPYSVPSLSFISFSLFSYLFFSLILFLLETFSLSQHPQVSLANKSSIQNYLSRSRFANQYLVRFRSFRTTLCFGKIAERGISVPSSFDSENFAKKNKTKQKQNNFAIEEVQEFVRNFSTRHLYSS